MLILDGLLFLLILLPGPDLTDYSPSPHELGQYCMLIAELRCFHVTEKVEQYLLCDIQAGLGKVFRGKITK